MHAYSEVIKEIFEVEIFQRILFFQKLHFSDQIFHYFYYTVILLNILRK